MSKKNHVLEWLNLIRKILFTGIKNIVKIFISEDILLLLELRKGLTIGDNCRIFTTKFGSEPYLIKIGNNVTIADGVRFITHDGAVGIFRDKEPNIESVAPIKIGNNVFIGINSIILPGTIIADNIIIGAGSIVKGELVKPGVYVGNPARLKISIDEYRLRLKNIEMTKNLGEKEKKDFYIEKYYR